MIEAQVPELADGGYWYVLTATPNAESDDPATANSAGYYFAGFASGCAWYGLASGSMMVAVRTPDIEAGIAVADPHTVSEVLQSAGATGKPFGRIGGL